MKVYAYILYLNNSNSQELNKYVNNVLNDSRTSSLFVVE